MNNDNNEYLKRFSDLAPEMGELCKLCGQRYGDHRGYDCPEPELSHANTVNDAPKPSAVDVDGEESWGNYKEVIANLHQQVAELKRQLAERDGK